MKDWPTIGHETDAELERADDLLGKADALLRRHRGSDAPLPDDDPVDEYEVALEDGDDLPILTDIVDDFDPEIPLLTEVAAAPAVLAPTPQPAVVAPPPGLDPAFIAEQLVELDTEIRREVEAWLATELPQILSREFDALIEKVRGETLAHLRATLLPTLSEHIASRLDRLDR